MIYKSETEKIRPALLKTKFLNGYGIDLGCSGDKIKPDAIGFDLPNPTVKCSNDVIEERGYAQDLSRFEDGTFDYVYSSHLLDEFVDIKSLLTEWLRVLKYNGYLVLYSADEEMYAEHCKITGQAFNSMHKNKEMSLKFMKAIVKDYGVEIAYEMKKHMDYSFLLVLQKIEPASVVLEAGEVLTEED